MGCGAKPQDTLSFVLGPGLGAAEAGATCFGPSLGALPTHSRAGR